MYVYTNQNNRKCGRVKYKMFSSCNAICIISSWTQCIKDLRVGFVLLEKEEKEIQETHSSF